MRGSCHGTCQDIGVSFYGHFWLWSIPSIEHQHFHLVFNGGKSILENGQFVRLLPDGQDAIFGAPGPFTTWEVDSKDEQWEMFNLGGVDGGYLEFCGTNYAFRSS